jgi:transposase-like protein
MELKAFGAIQKRRSIKFNGLRDDKFKLHLKESKFRWNSFIIIC